MKIDSIKMHGFKDLFHSYKTMNELFKNPQENRWNNVANSKLTDMLKKCHITLTLSEITTIELYYIYKMVDNVFITDEYINENGFKEDELNNIVKEMYNIIDSIDDDNDIDKLSSPYFIYPIGCINYNIIVDITSISHLIQLINLDNVIGLFNEDPNDRNIPNKYPDTEIIEKNIFNKFVNNLYTVFPSELWKFSDSDIAYRLINTDLYYNSLQEKQIAMYRYSSIHGDIDFFNTTGEKLREDIANLKNNSKDFPFSLPELDTLTVVLHTSFEIFFSIYKEMREVIIDHSRFLDIFSKKEINLDESLEKYSIRLNDILTRYHEITDNFMEANKNSMNLYSANFILNGNKVFYTIRIPMDKIDNLVETLKESAEASYIKESLLGYRAAIENILE